MTVRSAVRSFFVLAVVGVLAGCASDGGRVLDGRWLIVDVTQDSAACAGLVRGALFVRDGIVTGYVAHSTDGDFAISGQVEPDGELVDVQATGAAFDVDVRGMLGDKTGNGRWRTRDCAGGWIARREQ